MILESIEKFEKNEKIGSKRKRYRQVISALSLLGSFVILLTSYISSVYAARESKSGGPEAEMTAYAEDAAVSCGAAQLSPVYNTVDSDTLENESLGASPVVSTSEIEDATAASFEKHQDVRMYVNDILYPGLVYDVDGAVYVGISEFAAALCGGAAISESLGHVGLTTDKTSLSANAGEMYLTANERELWCRGGVICRDGEIMAPLNVLCAALGASRDESVSPMSVTSGSAAVESGDTYYDSESLYWLSRIISAESRGESLYGKIAVGNVVLNRVSDEAYPDTVHDVIFDERCGIQFTPAANGTIENEPDSESVTAAKLCLEGVSVSKSILYFLNPALAESFWIVDNRTYVTTIGNHEFYS